VAGRRPRGRPLHLRRRAGPGPGQREPGRRPLGAHHLRLLLGRLRHAHRRAGRPGGGRRGRPRPPRQPGPPVPQGPVRAPDAGRPRAPHRAPGGRPAGVVGRGPRPGGRRVPGAAPPARARVGGRAVDRPTGHRGVLRAGQAGPAGDGPGPLRRQHHAVHGVCGVGLQAQLRHRRPARLLRGSGAGRRAGAVGRQPGRQPPAAHAPGARARRAGDGDRRRPPGHQDGHGGRHPPAGAAPGRRGPAQRRAGHADRGGAGRPGGGAGPDRGPRRPGRPPGRLVGRPGRRRERSRRGRRPRPGPPHRRGRAVHDRLDDGGQPLGPGHPHGHPDQHRVPAHRAHRPSGVGAVLDHRAVQRDGHPRDRVHRLDARLPGLRRPRPPGRAPRCGASTSPGCRRPGAGRTPTSSTR